MLIKNDNVKFAPIKYVYVMDILETLRGFVFMRMKTLAFPNLDEKRL